MEPPNEAVRSAAPRASQRRPRSHELKQGRAFARNDCSVWLANYWMEKQSTENKGPRVSKPATSVTNIKKSTLVWSTTLSTLSTKYTILLQFILFMNELQLQPLRIVTHPGTGRKHSKKSNQTEGQKRASIKANHRPFYNPPSLITPNSLTFPCKSDLFIAELINRIISYNYTNIKYKRAQHLQIHFQLKVKY